MNNPTFGPLRSASQIIGTIEANVTEPPSGKTTKVIKLKAVLRAVKIAISARI
jgi:hypothetical protein